MNKRMDNHTVMQLKAIAKDRGIRCYYKLRKEELIHALEATSYVEQTSNIFDESILNYPTAVLQPTPCSPSNITTKVKQKTKNFLTKGMQKIKDFGKWLLNCISRKPKVVDKVLLKIKLKKYQKRDTLFQPTQSKSALKNFAIEHQIKVLNGYDPESFLLNSKKPATNLMISTRQTKVKLILSCMMKMVDRKVVK